MEFFKARLHRTRTNTFFFTSSAAAAKKLFPDLCWDSCWLSRANKRNKHKHIVYHIKFYSWQNLWGTETQSNEWGKDTIQLKRHNSNWKKREKLFYTVKKASEMKPSKDSANYTPWPLLWFSGQFYTINIHCCRVLAFSISLLLLKKI